MQGSADAGQVLPPQHAPKEEQRAPAQVRCRRDVRRREDSGQTNQGGCANSKCITTPNEHSKNVVGDPVSHSPLQGSS